MPPFVDPTAIAGMIFTLIIIAMVGGFILLFPLTRRLGALLEQRVADHVAGERTQDEAVRRLEAEVRALERKLEDFSERQSFIESLLNDREARLLPTERPEP